MSSCEKCWNDAHSLADAYGSVAEAYQHLLEERRNAPCTPEEQAGPDATACPDCNRKTRHQWTGECMACGKRPEEAR